jgi:zinc resistance-associated protein
MKKHLLLAATAALLVFTVIGLPATAETTETAAQAKQASEDHATLVEAKIAALKTGLKLTTEQEKNWESLEKVLREVAAARSARRAEARQQASDMLDKDEVIAGMKLGARLLKARSEDLEKVSEAAAPLFASMDEAQKHRFALLLHTFAGRSAE